MAKYTAQEIDRLIEQAAHRAAGVYYEQTKHDFGLIMESTDFIKQRLENMVTRDEFNELRDEVKLIRLAVTDTNKDLRQLDKRVSLLTKDD
jgi:hypothetical protein